MKQNLKTLILAALLAITFPKLYAQGTAFTYQGRLDANGAIANGIYNFAFTLYDTNTGGNVVAYPMYYPGIPVTNGLFQVTVDFGPGMFTGPDRWLEIGVCTNSPGINVPPYVTYIPLTPRQQVTASPYAIFAGSASNLVGALPASQIAGTIAPSNIAAGTITPAMLSPGAISMLGAPDGSPTNAVQVDNNGLVGIGTSTPAAGLQIASGATITTLPVLFEVENGQKGWTNIAEVNCSAINGNLLAVGGLDGVTIATLTNPAAPKVLSAIVKGTGGFTNFSYITELAWAGSNLIATAWGATSGDTRAVNIISCTNPSSPVKLAELRKGVGGWNNLGAVQSLAVSGNLLAIGVTPDTVTNYDSVTLADISNPAAPVQRSVIINGVGGFTNLYGIYSLAFSGNTLAIGAVFGVTLVDVSNPANPVKLAELRNGVGPYTNWNSIAEVSFSGNVLAVGSFGYSSIPSVVTLLDVSNPANPVKLSEVREDTGGYSISGVRSVRLSGNRMVIGAQYPGTVTLVDVSNPSSPQRLAMATAGVNGADYIFGPHAAFAGTNIVTCGSGAGFDFGVTVFGVGTQSAGLSSAGWVGIGTTQPIAALDVVGDVVFENAALFDANARRVALGHEANAAGDHASAIGNNAAAAGDFSVAIGNMATASGYGATAIGQVTTASGGASTAVGYFATASGDISTAMGFESAALHNNTFVWSDGTIRPFASSTSNEFSICAQNGVRIQSDRGIHLNATNGPIIVRDGDAFANNASGGKAGIGRWGLFMETNTLVAGIPGDDVSGKSFAVAKYSTNGTPTTLMQVDQSGNLTVSNDVRVVGLIRSGTEAGTFQAPNPAGLVVRRINSTVSISNSVVAVARTLLNATNVTLVRDGTAGGFQIQYPAGSGNLTIACMGIDSTGTQRNFYTAIPSGTAGTVQIYANSQNIVHFECSFGITYNSGQHLTRVTLSRYTGDNFWSGDLVSTYNQ